MSSDQFNNGSLPKYENHVQVFKATSDLTTQSLQNQQPSMEEAMEMMFDPEKAEAFAQKQKEQLNTMILDLEKVKKTVQNSDALDEDVRDAFTTSFLAQQSQIAAQAKIMDAQLNGSGSEQDLMIAAMEMQEAQAVSTEKTQELQKAIYKFQDGDTFNASTLSADLTIEEFEQAAALIAYGNSTDDAMQSLAASMQTGDMSALDDLIDMLEETKQSMNTLANVANASAHMTDEQKTAATDYVSATADLMDTMVTTFEGLAQGDMSAMENLMKLPEAAQKITSKQSAYYDVLDKRYQEYSKPSNNNTQDKKGPKNGSNNL